MRKEEVVEGETDVAEDSDDDYDDDDDEVED